MNTCKNIIDNSRSGYEGAKFCRVYLVKDGIWKEVLYEGDERHCVTFARIWFRKHPEDITLIVG